jgi:hypothetical protein
MEKKRGRPKKAKPDRRSYAMQVRLSLSEKTAFEAAAKLAGLPLSMWVRERLRSAARAELDKAGYPRITEVEGNELG